MFNVKDPIPKSLKYNFVSVYKFVCPKSLKSFVVYKFVCSCCNASYIGETTRHLSTRIKERLETDKESHIFAHLVNNETCKAPIPSRLKLKEAMHIIRKKPLLDKQQKHVSVSITV